MNQFAPTLDDFEAMARKAWEALPAPFRQMAGDVVFRIQDFAEDDILAEVDLDSAYELTGLYLGVDLTQASIMAPSQQAPMVFLYRRAIMDEWIERGDVALDALVAHVLVHEIGHHFGLSDEAMDAILETT